MSTAARLHPDDIAAIADAVAVRRNLSSTIRGKVAGRSALFSAARYRTALANTACKRVDAYLNSVPENQLYIRGGDGR